MNDISICVDCKSNNCICLIPKRKTGIIKIIKKILHKPEHYNPSNYDFLIVKNIFYKLINEDNLSPFDINIKFNLGYANSTLAVHISKTFDIKLKSTKEGTINYFRKNNKIITDERKLYWKNCQFSFSPYKEPNILGYDLLKDYTFSNPQSKEPNKKYLHRDHMVSIAYGWENNIPSEHICHPANCEIMLEHNNISKGSGCSITYEHLLERIHNWDLKSLPLISSNTNRVKNKKLSIKNKGKKIYNNGIKHFTVYDGDYIDPSWMKGYLPNTKKKYFWFNDGIKNYRVYTLLDAKPNWNRGKITPKL